MQIDAVVFDWSGTISDDRRLVYRCNIRMLDLYERPSMSFEEWLRQTASPAVMLRNAGVHVVNEREAYFLYEGILEDEWKMGNFPTVYPNACAAVRYVKQLGKRMGIVSMHPEENIRIEAKCYGIGDCFSDDAIVGDTMHDKVEGLILMSEHFGVKPERMLYVGDMAQDIQAAKAAGMRSAAVCGGYHERERLETEKPDFVWSDINGIVCAFANGELR